MNAWTLSQTESLESATRWGLNWTMDEIELVETTMDEPVFLLATILERSVYSVSTMRGLIRDGYSLSTVNRNNSRHKKIEIVCQSCNLVAPATGCDCES